MSPPPGYHFPSPLDSQVQRICERCGASVVASAVETHDAWHRALQTMIMVSVREELTRRGVFMSDVSVSGRPRKSGA